MKNSVIIKSFKHGISLHLPADDSMEEVLEKIAFKFKESAAFFKDAKMVLTIEGKALTDEEENEIIRVIEENSDIKILCLVSKAEDKETQILRAVKEYQNLVTEEKNENPGQFYRGNLKSGQVLESDSSIIILGDVDKGANVISKKDIIVIGGLYGNAYAGGGGGEGHFILALDIAAECLKIGKYRYTPPKKQKWSFKAKKLAKIAYVSEEAVLLEPISQDFVDKI